MPFEWREVADRIFRGRAMVGYLLALLAVALAAGIRFGLEPWLAGRAHYLVFIVAVFIAALFGGTWPAIVAALLSCLFVQLLDGGSLHAPAATAELVTFVGTSGIVIWLVHVIVQWRGQAVLDEGRARLREEGATRLAEEHELLIAHLHGHAVLMLDPDGHIRIWSKGAERLFGWREDEMIGQPGDLLYSPEAIAAGRSVADRDRAQADGGFAEDGMRVDRYGAAVAVHVGWSALHDPRGRFRGYAQLIRGRSA